MTNVTWIGIGRMGWPMAVCVASTGHSLSVYDSAPDKRERARSYGMRTYSDPALAAEDADVTILCVKDGRAVDEAVFGSRGVARSMAQGGIIVDHGTMDPDECRAMALRAQSHGLSWVDAPVSRHALQNGEESLVSWLGGEQAAITRVEPLLKQYIAELLPVGSSGAGQAVKCCNQLIVAGSAALWDSTFELSQVFGITPLKLLRLLRNGAAGSPVRNLLEGGLERGEPVATIFANAVKDLRTILHQAEKHRLPLTLAADAVAQLERARDAKPI
ncbi:NAD(P)-dependent oxidoreductase [Paraburkholderia sp. CNPSo 3076]|nr:NAD(P)-dependent oxidoreductase [Paraburkholderia sp. CNPSo 3076]